MKLHKLLENMIDLGSDNKLSEPPEKPANTKVLEKKIEAALHNAMMKFPSNVRGLDLHVKANGATVEITSTSKEGKTTTNRFTTSHVMKYINNPKALAEMVSRTGYYA